MAIYVYKTNSGALHSWIPDDLTVVEAQDKGLLASDAALAANRMTAVDSLPPLDETHAWDPAQKTVIEVPAPKPILRTHEFILLFTDAEYTGVLKAGDHKDATYGPRIAKFNAFLRSEPSVDLNSQYVKDSVNHLVTKGILTQAEADRILSGQGY
jgi:hypothetical protein